MRVSAKSDYALRALIEMAGRTDRKAVSAEELGRVQDIPHGFLQAILADLRDVMGSRTAFIISHRVSAVMHADKILVLDDGRIVQEGVHADLIATEGTYARLLRRQLLEEKVEAEPAGLPGS